MCKGQGAVPVTTVETNGDSMAATGDATAPAPVPVTTVDDNGDSIAPTGDAPAPAPVPVTTVDDDGDTIATAADAPLDCFALDHPVLMPEVIFAELPQDLVFDTYMASTGAFVDDEALLAEQVVLDSHEAPGLFLGGHGDSCPDDLPGLPAVSLPSLHTRPWKRRKKRVRRRFRSRHLKHPLDFHVIAPVDPGADSVVQPFADTSQLHVQHSSDSDHLLKLAASCDVAPDCHTTPDDSYLDQAILACPAPVCALSSFKSLLNESGLSVNAFYGHLHNPVAVHAFCAHLDAGAQGSTTDQLSLLFDYKETPNTQKSFRVADGTVHFPQGFGFAKLRTLSGRVLCHQVWYTPGLSATIFSPMALAKEYCCGGYASVGLFGTGTTSTLRLLHCRTTLRNIDLECTLRNGLLFSAPLLLPGSPGADTAEDITILNPAEADRMCQVDDPNPEPSLWCHPGTVCRQPCPAITVPADLATCPSCNTDGPCDFLPPPDPVLPPSVCDEMLFIQRLGFQDTLSLHATAQAVGGSPSFSGTSALYAVAPPLMLRRALFLQPGRVLLPQSGRVLLPLPQILPPSMVVVLALS